MKSVESSAVRFGVDGRDALSALCRSRGWNEVWLIADRHIRGDAIEFTGRLPVSWCPASPAPHNPVEEFFDLLRDCPSSRPQAIVAIGGGSALDFGKALLAAAIFDRRPAGENDLRILARQLEGDPRPRPDLVLIPTTYSTAAFTTNAGLTLGKGKFILRGENLRADWILGDDMILQAGGAHILPTIFGPLNNCLEGTIARRQKSTTGVALLEVAASTIFESLEGAIGRTMQPVPTGELLTASWLASLGIQGAALGAGHAVPHILGAVHGVPHATASALMIADLLRRRGDPRLHVVQAAMECFAMPASLDQIGIDSVARTELEVPLSTHSLFHRDVSEGRESSAKECLSRLAI